MIESAAAHSADVNGTRRNQEWWITRLSETLGRVRALVAKGEVRVSAHGYEELAADNISVRDIVEGLTAAVLVTAYRPDATKWDETWQGRRL